MSAHSAENDMLIRAIATVLAERMDRGTSGRLIADYGVTIHGLACEIASVIPPEVGVSE